MKNSPTFTDRPLSPAGDFKNSSVAIAEARRGNVPPLFLYVPDASAYSRRRLVQAHLRNHRGYLELCWREGKAVKTVHLGKAAKHFPTRGVRRRNQVRGPGRRRRAGAGAAL